MRTELKIRDHGVIPEAARPFFPSPIDGYLYLIDRGDAGFECRRHSYGDSHPWKNYRDTDRLVEMLPRQAGENLIASVAAWNAAAEQAQAQAEADRQAEAVRVQAWVNALPSTMAGFRREGADLLDSSGNVLFSLDSPQFLFRAADDVETEIAALVEDGFDPGA